MDNDNDSSSDTDDDSYLSESELGLTLGAVNPVEIYVEACRFYNTLPVSCVVDNIMKREWLDINNRGLNENDAYCIKQVIDVANEVKGVNVSGNYIQTRGIHELLLSLSIHKIVHLNISNTGIKIESNESSFSKEILISIMKMPGLTELDISNNKIGDVGMEVRILYFPFYSRQRSKQSNSNFSRFTDFSYG
jgi:hypothetical protein